MFLHIIDARYLEDYKLEVTFNNGRKGIADLADALKGSMFEPLKNESIFSRLVIDKELYTIVWSNGADLAPGYQKRHFRYRNNRLIPAPHCKHGALALAVVV